MAHDKPEAGEIWEDADGCLMTFVSENTFVAFYSDEIIPVTSPLVAQPLRRIFRRDGGFCDELPLHAFRLRYPNGDAYKN